MTDTLGKTVTLPLGLVVTDVGSGVANGKVDPRIRKCVADNGDITYVIARVIRELPVTHRRAEMRGY